jgi:uncharacterized membrane protein
MRNKLILLVFFGLGTLLGISAPVISGAHPAYSLSQILVERMVNGKGTLVIKRVMPAVTLLLHHSEHVTEEASEVYLPIIQR